MFEVETINKEKCLINPNKITHVLFKDNYVIIYFGSNYIKITFESYSKNESQLKNI